MSISHSEKEIQNYIWEVKEDFPELLVKMPKLQITEFASDLSDVNPSALVQNHVFKKIQDSFDLIDSISLIGIEVGLEQSKNSVIRADFIGTFLGTTGVGIIELKKSKQTERQAFTELLAYSNHMTNLFPTMSKEDIVYILISPMETRICRDAVLQSLLFDGRKVVALIPEFEDENDVKSLKLRPWLPKSTELAKFSSIAFREENFDVYSVVWKYSEGWWDAPKGESPSGSLVGQMNDVSALAAQFMEESGIHGFTYCSQTWSELEPVLPYTNTLVLVGLNPYSVGGIQYYLNKTGQPDKVPSAHMKLPLLSEMIPSLAKKPTLLDEEYNLVDDLRITWSAQLFRIGKKVVDAVTKTSSGHSPHTDQGCMDWETFQTQMLEDVYCHRFNIRSTGLLRHMYLEMVNLDYEACKKCTPEEHPIHGDIPYNAIEMITSQHYFRFFIRRLMGDEEDA